MIINLGQSEWHFIKTSRYNILIKRMRKYNFNKIPLKMLKTQSIFN